MRLIDSLRAVVSCCSERVAVREYATGSALTYAELWQRANSLSARLANGRRCAILLKGERSCQFLVRLLAVWLADHTPLILHPCTPVGRLEELLGICGAYGQFSETGFQLCPGRHARAFGGVEYLATTSGTSGKAKVVQIADGSLVKMLAQQVRAFELSRDAIVLWVLSPGFDASLSDIGVALSTGAQLICAPSHVYQRLPSILEQTKATHLDLPPSVLALHKPGDFPITLKTLIVGGEASDPEVLRQWSRCHRLVAVYGPSEATICSSLSVVDEAWTKAYIGQPLEGVRYEVDDDELLIGGQQVGLGYLQFAPGSFFSRDGLRWYRTGDRVGSWSAEHGYHFLGRIDRQVQLRGERIEPEEIEQRARKVLGTQNVSVVLRGTELILFWQVSRDRIDEEKRLRVTLADVLPASWIPQHFVPLIELPRTPSGKVDQKCLSDVPIPGQESQLDSLGRLNLQLKLERGARQSTLDLRSVVEELLRTERKCLSSGIRRKRPVLKKKKLLLTGGTGRFGKVLAPMLEPHFEVWKLTRQIGGSRCLVGDMTLPQLGLKLEDWEFLRQEVDLVVNLAGRLDVWANSSELRPLNCDSLLALRQLEAPIHHASSLAVPLSAVPAATDSSLQQIDVSIGGYAQSKWMAEYLLERTGCEGYSFRYGQLLGQADKKELLALVIVGLWELGYYPDSPGSDDLVFDVTPITWAAKETLTYLLSTCSTRRTLVLRRGWQINYADLIEILCRVKALRPMAPSTFFALTGKTFAAVMAQRALWRTCPELDESSEWTNFDLFLLSRAGLSLKSTPEAVDIVESYAESLSDYC